MKQRNAYLLISTTLFAGVVLVACSAGYSTTGHDIDLPPIVQEARLLIRPAHPEASYMPIKVSNERTGVWAWHRDCKMYITDLWLDGTRKDIYSGAPIIVHEYAHCKGANESEARAIETRVRSELKA